MMKTRKRNRKGATLGLVATCAVIIAIIGVAFFFLSEVINGSREVSNAVDAGVLNTAKKALSEPTINATAIGTPEFSGLGENDSDEIALITYNRAVALTLMVAMNAQEENTTLALNRSQLLSDQLKVLGKALRDGLSGGSNLNDAFDSFATINNVKMMGKGNTVSRFTQVDCAYMKAGGSTNVFFNPASLSPTVSLSAFLNTDPSAKKSTTGQPFLRGYVPVALANASIFGVPVFPGDRPHLVATRDFNNSGTLPAAGNNSNAIPPNTYRGRGQARRQQSPDFVGSVACAIVGCLDRQYDAKLPLGYVRIFNREGVDPNPGWGVCTTDGDNDLFNKELFAPSHIMQANNGVFTTDEAQMNAWIAFNNGNGPDPSGSFNLSNMRIGPGRRQAATRQDLEGIMSIACDCNHTMYDGSLGPGSLCLAGVPTWSGNYARSSRVDDIAPNDRQNKKFNTIEYMKLNVLVERAKGGARQIGAISLPPEPTGMKKFDHNAVYATPGSPIRFGQNGTPWELMNMVGPCSTQAGQRIFDELMRRCHQFKPGVTTNEVIAALNSRTIPMGTELYLYAAPDGRVLLDDVGPRYRTAIPADGTRTSPTLCEVRYNVNNLSVNSIGDGNFTSEAPYSSCGAKPGLSQPPEYKGIDRVMWTPSSGYQNLLGVMEFENYATCPAEFSMPN